MQSLASLMSLQHAANNDDDCSTDIANMDDVAEADQSDDQPLNKVSEEIQQLVSK
jgi:hypothetical protein